MYEVSSKLKENPFKTKQDTARALLDMVRPLKEFYSPGKAYVYLGNTGAHYGSKTGGMEGFARILWGIGPLLSGKAEDYSFQIQKEIEEWFLISKEGIINGTNPLHKEYWGDLKDYDQMMVEMASLVTTISLNKEKLWNDLNENEKENIYSWLNRINTHKVHPNNWRFFRILVNMMFQLLNLPWNEENLNADLEVIENCYMGDGWYFDGNAGQVDYYIPFAMHFYGLIYAGLMKEKDKKRSVIFIERGRSILTDYLYWFSADGSEIPFGRSLTYRFAHSAFFAALSYSGEENLPWGIIKGTFLRNLRHWFSKPIFDGAGFLTIGYEYPNLFMSERYNSPGSPYWALKAFLVLAVDEEHPFWRAEEESFEYDEVKLLKHPNMLITHNRQSNQVQAFTTGQHCMNHGSCEAKYEKFVYSNHFGFSVMRGNTLEEGAFDNTLAVSAAGDNFYKMRYGVKDYKVTETYLTMKYNILPQVEIKTSILPIGLWHVRIHDIKAEIDIDIADGGFALNTQQYIDFTFNEESVSSKEIIKKDDSHLMIEYPWGYSGVLSLQEGELEVIRTFPNTNLMSNLTVIPTFKKRLYKGEHRIITAFAADKDLSASKRYIDRPNIKIREEEIEIKLGEKAITFSLDYI